MDPQTSQRTFPRAWIGWLIALAVATLLVVLLDAARTAAAALPIVSVLVLMIGFHQGSQRAGPAAWAIGAAAAYAAYGLTSDVFWVSQGKGLLISIFVLAVLWPALLLYHVVAGAGGVQAVARALQTLIRDRGLLLLVVAWAFSGMLEGLAGFGIPVAIVSPILVSLGVSPVIAVAAVAVGHAWSVTFGDMGVVFETLIGLVDLDETRLASVAALLLGIACVAVGLGAARILGEGRRQWRAVLVLGVLMAVVQYALARIGLIPLSAFGAGLVGIVGGVMLDAVRQREAIPRLRMNPPLRAAITSYGGLTVLLTVITVIPPLYDALAALVWQVDFPGVETGRGFATPPGAGQVIRPLVHPGFSIIVVALASYPLYRRQGLLAHGGWKVAAQATYRSAMPATWGIVSMVGLSTLMSHTGMTLRLAEASAGAMDRVFPVVSPLVGMLGAFATGSNNNSNVLFAALQEDVAHLLALAPGILVAAQTTGGALGSMIAPAKIVVGCSTVGLHGRDGDVLRLTLPYGIGIGLGLGVLALGLALL